MKILSFLRSATAPRRRVAVLGCVVLLILLGGGFGLSEWSSKPGRAAISAPATADPGEAGVGSESEVDRSLSGKDSDEAASSTLPPASDGLERKTLVATGSERGSEGGDPETASDSKPTAVRGAAAGGVKIDLSSVEARARTVAALQAREDGERERAIEWALENGEPISGTTAEGGSFALMGLDERGVPIYAATNNVEEALAANVTPLQRPVYGDGSGWKVGVIDGKSPMLGHPEFGGRVVYRDDEAANGSHSTHVCGTIGAAGYVAAARGMANQVGIVSYQFDNGDVSDMAGMAAVTEEQVLGTRYVSLSNHSYGQVDGWEYISHDPPKSSSPSGATGYHWMDGADPAVSDIDSNFGRYSGGSQAVDAVCDAAPYYLPIWAAGNDRNDAPKPGTTVYVMRGSAWVAEEYSEAVHPAGDGPFDCISSYSGAKNVLTVGAYTDAVGLFSPEDGFQISAGMFEPRRIPSLAKPTGFSGFGPMDDGRIKPDLVTDGYQVYSTDTESLYSSKSGTSMAAPVATGAAVLLQQRYHSLLGGAMRASTLKGLMIHTADDIGLPGPDPASGFGLLNAKAAADHISLHYEDRDDRHIHEGTLVGPGSDQDEFYVTWDGLRSIRATLCWTDRTGEVKAGLNDRTPDLVHDLDLRIIAPSGRVIEPWKLDAALPMLPATRGDNTVDNVERIDDPTFFRFEPMGPFKVVVTHKGNLQARTGKGFDAHSNSFRLLPPFSQAAPPPSQVYSLLLSGVGRAGTFAEAVDNESEEFHPTGAMADLGWGFQKDYVQQDDDAAQSPAIGDGETTGFETTVTGPAVVSFWVKTDTESSDAFQFRIDGVETGDPLSGDSGWQFRSSSIPAGSHTLSWEYAKNAAISAGRDRVWVDRIGIAAPATLVSAAADGFGVSEVRWSYARPSSGYVLYHNATAPDLIGATSRTVGATDASSALDLIHAVGGWYAVKVIDATGAVSELSNWLQSEFTPAAPTDLTATDGVFTDRIEVRWSRVNGADEYVITRTPEGGVPQEIVRPSTGIGAGTEVYQDFAAAPGEVIHYSVRARTSAGAAGDPSPPDTGYRLDLADFVVSATDGTLTREVHIQWPVGNQNAWFRCVRTTTNVSPAEGGNAFTEIRSGPRISSATDTTAIPGVTYYYWVEAAPFGEETLEYDLLGSDSGWAGAFADYDYAIQDSDDTGGPAYQWVDISSTGTQVQGEQLITPTSVLLQQGTQYFPVGRLIDNSGLNGVPTLANFATISHAAATNGDNAWVTDAVGSDYFEAGGPSPLLLFDLPSTSFDAVRWNIRDLVVWGYHFGAGGHPNEAKRMRIDCFRETGSGTVVGGISTVETTAPVASAAARLPMTGGDFPADQVRMYLQDNWSVPGLLGNRVGLGEVKFIAERSWGFSSNGFLPVFGTAHATVASRHGYLSDDFDLGEDATNATSLPAAPGANESGIRVMPYHDALDLSAGGAVYFQQDVVDRHPSGGPGERAMVMQWENVRLASGGAPFSFQAIAFQDSGDWVFQYKPGNPGGGGATIGIQDAGQNKAVSYAINEAGAIPTDRGFAIRFELEDPSPVAAPQPQLVTTLSDENDAGLGMGSGDSLRELLAHAPAGPDGAVRIEFPASMAGATIALNSQLTVTRPSTVIDASSAPGLVVSGQQQHRIFNLDAPDGFASLSLFLRGLTLADGWVSGHGGAILTDPAWSGNRTVNLENVTITNCRSNGSGSNGGAIAVRDSSSLVITNSTLSGNRAAGGGGAIWMSGVNNAPGIYRITNSTLTDNESLGQGTTGGGGILNQSASEYAGVLSSSIVAGNVASAGGADIQGPSWSTGYNLIGSVSGTSGLTADDVMAADPGLEALADNGGGTWTHALLPTSPAVDAGAGPNGGAYLATDQRGVPRGGDGDLDTSSSGPDIGAFEVLSELVVTTAADVIDPNDGVVSLREAVAVANVEGEGAIRFDTAAMGTTTCTLFSPISIDVVRGLSIDGGAVVLDAGGSTRHFVIEGDSVVAMNELSMVNGNAAGGTGGAIRLLSNAVLTMTRCELRDNASSGSGGAIDNSGGGLALVDCSLSGNSSAARGGAIFSQRKLRVVASTLAGNHAQTEGGAIFSNSTLDLRSATISGNTADLRGGGIFQDPAETLGLKNSIVAGNSAPDFPEIDGTITGSSGINLTHGDPRLAPLGDYGGPGLTQPPLAGSPALDRLAGGVAHRLVAVGDPVASGASFGPGSGPEAAFDGDPATVFEGYAGNVAAFWDFEDSGNATASADRIGGVEGTFLNVATRGLRPVSYAQDFAGFSDGIQDLADGTTLGSSVAGQATVRGGALRLTQDGVADTRSSFRIPALANSSAGWTASFDFAISGTQWMADGLSFSYGAIPPLTANDDSPDGHGGGEEGWPGTGHLAFEIAIYEYDGDRGTAISVNGTDQVIQRGSLVNPSDSVSGTATLSWDPVNGASFSTTGLNQNANFTHVPTPGFTASDAHVFAFGARTGGDNATILIDNVVIETMEADEDHFLDLRASASSRMEVGDASFLNGAAADDTLTIAFWQKLDSVGNSRTLSAASPSGPMRAHLPWGDGIIYFDTPGNASSLSGPPPPGTVWTQWTHVALVKNGPRRQVWIDGRLATEDDGAPALPLDFQSLALGSNEGLAGQIDDFAVFSDALDGGEIQEVMANRLPAPEVDLTLALPGGPDLATELVLTAGPDRPAADPVGFRIEGSNDEGAHYDLIAEEALPAFASRGATQRIPLEPATAYATYRLTFTGVADPKSADGIRVSEVALAHDPSIDSRGAPRVADGSGSFLPRADLGAVESRAIVVDTVVDENDGVSAGAISLRDALAGEAEIVRFDPLVFDGELSDAIVLTHGPLAVPGGAVSIDALSHAAKVHVSGGGAGRVLEVSGASTVMVLRNMALRDGMSATEGGGVRIDDARVRFERCEILDHHATGGGGGLLADGGVVEVVDSTIRGNASDGLGGGFKLLPGSTCTVRRSTFHDNHAGPGGGAIHADGATFELINATLHGNLADDGGGAIDQTGGAVATVLHSTISGNASANRRGGIESSGGATLILGNSIVADNSRGNIGGGIATDLGGNVTSGDPRLAPLAWQGGPTGTMALRHDSPALDAGVGSLPGIPATDQRGFGRATGGAPDSGAFESQALAFVSTIDRDQDGMSDEWEVFYGLDPLDPADAELEWDGDGQSNRAEFEARTQPLSAASALRIVGVEPTPAGLEVRWTSEPGLVYSIWSSSDLESWVPVPGSNLIAIEAVTRLSVGSDGATRRFLQVRTGFGDESEPAYAEPLRPLAPVAAWDAAEAVSSGDGTAVSQWTSPFGGWTLMPVGAPRHLLGATPTGRDAVDFRGSVGNDAFFLAANPTPAFGAGSLTVAVAFQPRSGSESAAGSDWRQKAQLVNVATAGPADDWGLGYGEDSVWFGLGDAASGSDATLQVAAPAAMADEWWIAVATWSADDGNGAPRSELWLFDRFGNPKGGSGPVDPNVAAGTVGRFGADRGGSALTLGALASDPTARNFDGLIAATRLYEVDVDASVARAIAADLAAIHTNDAEPE